MPRRASSAPAFVWFASYRDERWGKKECGRSGSARRSGGRDSRYNYSGTGEAGVEQVMPKFRYEARRDGVSERGTMDADSKKTVIKRLREQGYEGVRVKRGSTDTGGFFRRVFGR